MSPSDALRRVVITGASSGIGPLPDVGLSPQLRRAGASGPHVR